MERERKLPRVRRAGAQAVSKDIRQPVPLVIPELTPEEQAERERALASILEMRAKLPPLNVPAAELVRQAREDLSQ